MSIPYYIMILKHDYILPRGGCCQQKGQKKTCCSGMIKFLILITFSYSLGK